MSLVSSRRVPKWVLVIDFLYGSDLETALNYSFNGAEFVLKKGASVRAGSVIFLVGVGSLVCWKIWDYWNSGGGDGAPCEGGYETSSPPPKGANKTPKAFFTSLVEEEFVQDFEEFEDEDPAFIQQLVDLGHFYIRKLLAGKYFGPESPVEAKLFRRVQAAFKRRDRKSEAAQEDSPVNSNCSAKSWSESGKVYLADNSASYSADDDGGSMTSDFEDESLPFDGFPDSVAMETKRVRKRRRRNDNKNLDAAAGDRSPGVTADSKPNYILSSKRYHPYGRNVLSPEDDFSSSETSPRSRSLRLEATKSLRISRLPPYQRRRGDGSETPDSEECKHLKSGQVVPSSATPTFYANYNSDEEWISDGRLQPDGEEEMQDSLHKVLSRDVSLSNLMGRLRQKSSQRSSLSRDNSVSSRMSDFLRRDDSICSNLSDFAYSECSEFSLELSIKDDGIAEETITSLADIEDELNTLKSSVLEMDEEFIKFASKPNPYLLKTTFSDYSFESSDSRPGSALDLITFHRSRPQSKNATDESSSDQKLPPDVVEYSFVAGDADGKKTLQSFQGSLEWGVPQHEWTSSKRIRIKQRRSSIEAALKLTTQEDSMPSLEWDNSGCMKQYEEGTKIPEENDDSEFNECQLDRHTFLPHHSSLELDLEKELLSPSDPPSTFCGREISTSSLNPSIHPTMQPLSSPSIDLSTNSPKPSYEALSPNLLDTTYSEPISEKMHPTSLSLNTKSEIECNPMSTSVDSAIHSAPGSRSGSSSPVPQLLTQSMMSSGIGTSCSEISELTPDSEVGTGYKLRKFWSSEESGYIEGENGLESSVTNLSPVHEIREKEVSEIANYSSQLDDTLCNDNFDPSQHEEDDQIEDFEINGNESTNHQNNNGNIMGNNTSSGYEDGSLTAYNNSSPQAVGEKQDVLGYALQEWQGSTSKAQTIRQGYSTIPGELNLQNLRRVRGDNYCGIRAVLYQMLSAGLPIPNGYQIFNRLTSEVNKGASWLKEYSFGRRLTYSQDQVVNGFKDCLEALDKFNLDLTGCENKECILLSRLNNDTQLDIRLCEAAKLHMLACSLDLYGDEMEGKQVPLFGMIMFARQSCLSPKDFMLNHLNPVGDSAGLEQIEMFLLGHALQVTLQVVRPSSFGSDDYICFYPDENIGVWPEVNLIAEDDRHYNVLVK